jgi:hypothetical protein
VPREISCARPTSSDAQRLPDAQLGHPWCALHAHVVWRRLTASPAAKRSAEVGDASPVRARPPHRRAALPEAGHGTMDGYKLREGSFRKNLRIYLAGLVIAVGRLEMCRCVMCERTKRWRQTRELFVQLGGRDFCNVRYCNARPSRAAGMCVCRTDVNNKACTQVGGGRCERDRPKHSSSNFCLGYTRT